MSHDKEQAIASILEIPRHIVWNDALATGIPSIDDQHRILVNIINDISKGLAGKYSRVALQRILIELRGYILYHFGREEQLMEQHGFESAHPNEQALHLEQHREFCAWLDNMEADIRRHRRISIDSLFTYLRDWLINHILHIDMHLAGFLKTVVSDRSPAGNTTTVS